MSSKEIISLVITDSHYNGNNTEEVNYCLFQAVERALELGVKRIFHIGDVFTSRTGRSFEELKAFSDFLSLIEDSDIEEIHFIPGNHDKQNQELEDSYLDIFERTTSKIFIHKSGGYFDIGKLTIAFMPFFTDQIYNEKLEYLTHKLYNRKKSGGNRFLFTHVAVNGVKNNDGSIVSEDGHNASMFSFYERVFIGHYHDRQEFGNFTYIGSLKQNNFGEDAQKGWMLFYEDGSYEFEKSSFVEYKTIEVNLNSKTAAKMLDILKNKYGNQSNVKLRIVLRGSEGQLSAVEKKEYSDLGIETKKVIENGFDVQTQTLDMIRIENRSDFLDSFEEFLSASEKMDEEQKEIGREIFSSFLKEHTHVDN